MPSNQMPIKLYHSSLPSYPKADYAIVRLISSSRFHLPLMYSSLALLLRVLEEDKELLQSLLPRVWELTQWCSQGLSYGNQVKTAISYW